MSTKIFVNLPVADLGRSMDFFRRLGWDFNPQFTDDTAACLVIGDDVYAMLLTHDKFRGFAPHAIGDARKATEVLLALTCESRAEIDDKLAKAVAAGATTFRAPEDHGFMYAQSFQDLDGHVWELFWMDPAQVAPANVEGE